MTLQELETSLANLTRAEKVEVLQRLIKEVANDWAGVDHDPAIAGGEARIVRTRIPIWTLHNYRCLGWSESTILDNYPGLRAADLVNAWAYTDTHRDEIRAAIEANENA
jgi:uncharacterized protein (DUF433 family)